MKHVTNTLVTRRKVVKGIGGLAMLSMSNATVAQAQEVLNSPLSTDPHTRATYQAIVDAVVPRTPELEDELGPEHVPGGLDTEVEKFIIWDFNHFLEIRPETLTTSLMSDPMSEETMAPELFEIGLDTAGAASELDAINQLSGVDSFILSAVGEIEDTLDFGAIDRFDISLADDLSSSGPVAFDLSIDTGTETIHTVRQNYPLAPLFAFVFDIVAAEFVAQGENHDAISRGNGRFAGGGTFVQLSREDRLRCLWTIVEEGTIDRLDVLLSPFVPQLGILKYVVMAINGLHGFGYYTEWSGYGATKTEMPNDRDVSTPPGKVQSRDQTGYPGPADGYAADWRRPVEESAGGFDDPPVEALDLPRDLTGEDIIDVVGGDR